MSEQATEIPIKRIVASEPDQINFLENIAWMIGFIDEDKLAKILDLAQNKPGRLQAAFLALYQTLAYSREQARENKE